jgi:hypothetical protein
MREDPMSRVAVRAVIPLLNVNCIPTSVAFYEHLGFEVANSLTPDGASEPQWASLVAGSVEIMLGRSTEANGSAADALYLYSENVEQMHVQAQTNGLAPSAITRPVFNPGGEFELADPDGRTIYVA